MRGRGRGDSGLCCCMGAAACAIGTTLDRLGSGCGAVGELPNGGATPCGSAGGVRRRENGENAGSSHCGCGCIVNGGGMFSTGRGVEKSTLGGGSVRRASSNAGGR